jgi:D-sedoheptulose 7-phosphate isomerase
VANNVDTHYATTAHDVGAFAGRYFEYLKHVLDSIDPASIGALAAEFERARSSGSTIFVAGNGGSSTTASTMANDIGFDVVKKTGTDHPFRVCALTDNAAVTTAIANDVGFEHIFVNQLRIHYRAGDSLVVISASGNSPNLVAAAEWVRARGGRVMALLGFDGGRMLQICDVVVHAPTEKGEYGPVEDAHLVINHVLAHWFQNRLRAEAHAV